MNGDNGMWIFCLCTYIVDVYTRVLVVIVVIVVEGIEN